MAEVAEIRDGRVKFLLEDARTITLDRGDPRLRHVDYAWASTVHAFQGRTVDNVIATMPANHPRLTTAKSFYVEISRARDRAELVTDDAKSLRERLEAATGERVSALECIGEPRRAERKHKSVPRLEPEQAAQLEDKPPQLEKDRPKYPEVPFPPLPDPDLDWAPQTEKRCPSRTSRGFRRPTRRRSRISDRCRRPKNRPSWRPQPARIRSARILGYKGHRAKLRPAFTAMEFSERQLPACWRRAPSIFESGGHFADSDQPLK